MTRERFKIECQRTCPTLGDTRVDLSHMVLGMNSELNELQDAIKNKDHTNIGEELADFQWYFYNYLTMRGYSVLPLMYTNSKYLNSNGLISLLYRNMSLLQDIVKKHIAYGKEINLEEEKVLLQELNEGVLLMYALHRLSEEEWLEKNIEKLKERFPDKFSTERAINRNTDSERQILEK